MKNEGLEKSEIDINQYRRMCLTCLSSRDSPWVRLIRPPVVYEDFLVFHIR